jgi:predicted benzoate:H+ symporter BenE
VTKVARKTMNALPCEAHAVRLAHLEEKDRQLNGSVKAVASELKEVRLALPSEFAMLREAIKSDVDARVKPLQGAVWKVGLTIVLGLVGTALTWWFRP